MRHLLFALLAATLVACSPGAGGAASAAAKVVHPESGLEVIPLTVTSASGTHSFKVEVARSAMEQARGLMFRTKLGPDEGMIFPMSPPRGASFWMRNTVISLDLIFIAPDGRISNIAAKAVPYDETPLLSIGAVKAVLEIPGGRAAELGIAPGDKVAW
ncbi:DUF192 domain-containing protein [Novosphingobium ginsenosidimutans]|uniref:DUF192 domain-containing protein n=1 Tax=Novosphingobium ginsenosidimutans TaxID=1176536 RepID=A0A5B8S3D6_9SPHN|nr:DUF192 domain-containing protein [Novosphingobium ginsenosidimutans]QEA15267.1 DUF192 domain-containing protein [Novosphingobium ginsenosidimutans]